MSVGTAELVGSRIIGIRHRVKVLAGGESRPTQIFIRDTNTEKEVSRILDDDNAELDFVLGRLPISWRPITDEDDLGDFPGHHVRWEKFSSESGGAENVPEKFLRKEGKIVMVATKVPGSYDGLRSGDKVAMVLGGSGDRLAYALTNRGIEIGASVYRIPPFVFQKKREESPEDFRNGKDRDAELLVQILNTSLELFYLSRPRDMNLIALREALRLRNDAMKARIACVQRLRQSFIGKVFLSEAGKYPEGNIEAAFDELAASDTIYTTLLTEEKRAESDLVRCCKRLDIFELVFKPIEGAGVMTSSRIISAVIDIRRFETPAKLKAFCGVHVLPDGRFPRRRAGQVANWHPDARQALWLLGDQFNRRPGSYWGQKLLEYKKKLRDKHPEPIVDEETGKRKYTNGHIHKMAMWSTLGKFVEALWNNWTDIERGVAPVVRRAEGASDSDGSCAEAA